MTAELVPVEHATTLVTLAAPTADIVQAQKDYLYICDKLLDAGDYQSIGSKSFRKKSGWRKLDVAYGVSHETIDKTYWYDDAGHICRAEFVVRATAPNGRHEDGVGLCDLSEKDFGRKQDHDIPATAHTRAKNRASADLFGLGEVSAEEADFGGAQYQAQVATRGRKTPAKAKPEPVRIEGTDELEARILKLSVKNRNAFKDARKSRGLNWPPESVEALLAMDREVFKLEARQEEEHAYEDAHPVGSSFD